MYFSEKYLDINKGNDMCGFVAEVCYEVVKKQGASLASCMFILKL